MTTINNPKNNNPPYFPNSQYNPATNNPSGGGSTQSLVTQLTPYFLKFPAAQGQEFLSDVIVNGDLIISDTNNQFLSNINLNMKGNILIDASSNYIQFGDGTIQNSAAPADDPYTVYADISNNFLSGTIQTFQGSNATIPTNAPLRFNNIDTSDYGSLFVDPNPNTDLTIYSNQTNGGLTISNPTNLITINPITGNIANFKNPITSDFGITGQSLSISNFIIFPNSQSTGISNYSQNSLNPIIYFALNDASNNQTSPLYIYYNAIQSNVFLNMTNHSILNTDYITFSDGTGQTTGFNPLLYAKLASPVFTGNPTAPTPITTDNDVSIATTQYVKNNLNNYATLASPSLTGTATLNTQPIATTDLLIPLAPINNPVFTGNARAPTPLTGDNDTTIATTQFVQNSTTTYTNTIQTITNATIITSLTPAVFYTISPKMCIVNISNLYFTGTTSQNFPYITIFFNTPLFPSPYTIQTSSVYGYIQNTTNKVLSFPQSYYLETSSNSISMYYNINNSNNYILNITFTILLT